MTRQEAVLTKRTAASPAIPAQHPPQTWSCPQNNRMQVCQLHRHCFVWICPLVLFLSVTWVLSKLYESYAIDGSRDKTPAWIQRRWSTKRRQGSLISREMGLLHVSSLQWNKWKWACWTLLMKNWHTTLHVCFTTRTSHHLACKLEKSLAETPLSIGVWSPWLTYCFSPRVNKADEEVN